MDLRRHERVNQLLFPLKSLENHEKTSLIGYIIFRVSLPPQITFSKITVAPS